MQCNIRNTCKIYNICNIPIPVSYSFHYPYPPSLPFSLSFFLSPARLFFFLRSSSCFGLIQTKNKNNDQESISDLMHTYMLRVPTRIFYSDRSAYAYAYKSYHVPRTILSHFPFPVSRLLFPVSCFLYSVFRISYSIFRVE